MFTFLWNTIDAIHFCMSFTIFTMIPLTNNFIFMNKYCTNHRVRSNIARPQRSQLRGLDYGRPVLELQSQVEQIKIARLNTFKWAFLSGQLLWWIPFVMVLFKGLFDVNLYTVSAFMPQFIAWNIAFGGAFIPFALWASRHLVGRLGESPRFQKFTDGIAGSDVVVARIFLGKLAQFGREADGR